MISWLTHYTAIVPRFVVRHCLVVGQPASGRPEQRRRRKDRIDRNCSEHARLRCSIHAVLPARTLSSMTHRYTSHPAGHSAIVFLHTKPYRRIWPHCTHTKRWWWLQYDFTPLNSHKKPKRSLLKCIQTTAFFTQTITFRITRIST